MMTETMTAIPSPDRVPKQRVVSCPQPATIKNCGSDVCVYDQCQSDLQAEHNSRVAAAASLLAAPAVAPSSDFATATTALMSLKKVKRLDQVESLPPKKKRKVLAAAADPRADLVRRAAEFTALLKETHPPGSPVFELYCQYVTAQRDPTSADQKRTIIALINLLKPTPLLLKKFVALMPKWCFTTSRRTTHS
mmetsp:Transcript_10325/g.33052  ORF Transcript_10325/g.33052 Transcript_10325/m.33052 type:complete len:193 (-) Transcript_10325:119-697(-)